MLLTMRGCWLLEYFYSLSLCCVCLCRLLAEVVGRHGNSFGCFGWIFSFIMFLRLSSLVLVLLSFVSSVVYSRQDCTVNWKNW